jgi:hypothetical protein
VQSGHLPIKPPDEWREVEKRALESRWHDQKVERHSKTFPRKAEASAWDDQIRDAKLTGAISLIDADLQPLSELVAEHFVMGEKTRSQRTLATDRDLTRNG